MSLRTVLMSGAIAMALAAPAAASEKLLVGSTSASSSHYGYFVAVGKLINDTVPGVEASVVETGATLDNLRRLQRDQIDLGLVTTNVAHHAYAGTGDFDGRPIDVRLLWVYSGAPQNVVVRADANVSALSELEGKRFNPGIRGSATENTTEAVFSVLGIEPNYVRGSTSDVVDMIKDNRVIGYAKSGAETRLDSSTIDIATFTNIKVLSLTPEQQEKLKAEMPDISIVQVPEGAASAGIPAYATWSFGVGVGTTSALSEETAYQIVKAAMEDKSVQAAAMASIGEISLTEHTMTYGTIPLHPGAVRYFREQGVDIPERLLPPSQ
ncbi:TAXI family TRAP transporter solute-binding subunit [Telmatospirillum sp. J64-1]|uniref:TAXI family TRAP transporter solute-binding subunit n=1 Tax=Telmatospirillum sp. J64-1 TaxID=2502183 RepID=UPI00115DFFFE|nr:TAXI family TRAP transporter solute-binding subunit [Telmatospirillum sp. J64-1]